MAAAIKHSSSNAGVQKCMTCKLLVDFLNNDLFTDSIKASVIVYKYFPHIISPNDIFFPSLQAFSQFVDDFFILHVNPHLQLIFPDSIPIHETV